jgi:putative lipoprotein
MSGRWLVAMCALGLAACVAAPGTGATPAASASLAGTRWVGVVGGDADPRMLPRIEFAAGGRMSGFTGCNTMGGAWTEENGAARFGAIAATKRFCVGAAGEVEKRVLAALGEGALARREGDKLVLTGPGGARFEFVAAAAT